MKAKKTASAGTGRLFAKAVKMEPMPDSSAPSLGGSLLKGKAPQASSTAQASHVMVIARAGSGKTTTMIEGLKYVKGLETAIKPSDQQQAIWDELAKSRDAQSIRLVAFNKLIADELQRRIPAGCTASTMHSMGNQAIRSALGFQSPKRDSYLVTDYIAGEMGGDLRQLRKDKATVLIGTEKLVGLCKQNLADPIPDVLDALCDHYDVDLNGSRTEVYDLVPRILELCRSPKGFINFDDMVWLPVALGLPVPQNDLFMVDESQDLTRAQQELAKKAGRRLVFVGDDRQAIYGFAGADAEAMTRLGDELRATERGLTTLPLTVTRRCGKAIVAKAQVYVPDFEAHESNDEGAILEATMKDYHLQTKNGDMVLCRINAPLVSQCLKFLKLGRKATVRGRDVGQGLVNLIEKLSKSKPDFDVAKLAGLLDDWRSKETEKELNKRFPNENKLTGIEDKYDCLICFSEGCETAGDMIRRIDSVFSDNKEAGVVFSTAHKAKGLEAENIFWIKTGFKPPKKQWQADQEKNIAYVTITRAIKTLTYVSGSVQ